ncbi:Cytochrome c oxidase subunit 4 [Coemansia sp. RSA 1085]|nr:cytochrome c oxidase subunit VB-domain-containing protein [Coemansia mojavensis]KAJ1743082.1 Cytochrome c oxidase subunit 4 [Coemansia sp. RSA 1086]KAJ2651098.1 Cytochrome c oxidase subunit 4 [Coemansia sp. RSA 1250]KAJ2668136.1 Cytochrome c oxidase subunit 4 [Coemansia sp. RSA 1085]
MYSAVRQSLIKAAPLGRSLMQRTSRGLFVSARLQSDDIVQGPGSRPDKVPTNFEQATGKERREYLAAMEGKEYFDLGPLYLEKKGTRQNPTIVPSGAAWRLVGCNGAPGEAHELMWIRVERSHGIDRCPECGNAFKLSEEGFDPNNLADAKHHPEY